MNALSILPGLAKGPILATQEPLSFWGGVDPASGKVIDVHHPLQGRTLTGAILMMPSTRGSCTGSGVLLDMVLSGKGPAALIFAEPEDVVTLGALIASKMFGHQLPVLRLSSKDFAELSLQTTCQITPEHLTAGPIHLPIQPPKAADLTLTEEDRAVLGGEKGASARLAMEIICAMAAQQGAKSLIDVSQAHIDGCIYASPANLTFAEKMADLGGQVTIPTTMNAISVDHANWRTQGVPESFGGPAQRLADAYVKMGCQASFTCSPYLLKTAPDQGENIAWSESNAVIFANSVLGARTAKHPDFLDLCIALTGRAPQAGVYLPAHRQARRVIQIDLPKEADDALWPLIGYLAGGISPDRIPVLIGLETTHPSGDDLKALCAAFGTTSAAPMLHIAGITPEADLRAPDADQKHISQNDMREGWLRLNQGPQEIDLIAIGSPHASAQECRDLARLLAGQKVVIPTIVTAGRETIRDISRDGTAKALSQSGVKVIPDLCWCSISEPVFPPKTRSVMTNSGKYAHYGPGLSGRKLRFAGLSACVKAALTGHAAKTLPPWLQ